MIGTAIEVVRVDLSVNRVGNIAGEGSDEFSVRQPNRACGLRRPSARHELANGRSNTSSLGHGLPPWLGLGPAARWHPRRRSAKMYYTYRNGRQAKCKTETPRRPTGHWARSCYGVTDVASTHCAGRGMG